MEEESPTRDAQYLRGLREAVHCGVEYGIELLANGQERSLEVPIALSAQARSAARQRIPLEVVIRRYLAGKALLSTFVIEEAAAAGIHGPELIRNALATYETEFDGLLALVTEEYGREEQGPGASREAQLADRTRRLIEGEAVDPAFLNYDLGCHHLALVAGFADSRQLIKKLASETNSRPLIVRAAENEVWAWLGSKEPLDPEAIHGVAASVCPSSAPLGLGEPAKSLAGWRLTHRQARAALSIARASEGIARYAEVSIIASLAQDPLMLSSLQRLYILPLSKERGNGDMYRKTLRAYYAANGNRKSAAAALGVSRQTVSNRLGQIEERLGQKLSACATALDAALRLEELGLLSA